MDPVEVVTSDGMDGHWPVPPDLGSRLREHALAHLARYAASRAMLRRVLVRKARKLAPGADPASLQEAIDAALGRVAELGLIDDLALAAARTRNLNAAGTSSRMIAAKLAFQGIGRADREQALRALRESEPEADLRAAVTLARRRRLGVFREPQDRAARRQRDLAALMRAGFAQSLARRVVDAADPSELDED